MQADETMETQAHKHDPNHIKKSHSNIIIWQIQSHITSILQMAANALEIHPLMNLMCKRLFFKLRKFIPSGPSLIRAEAHLMTVNQSKKTRLLIMRVPLDRKHKTVLSQAESHLPTYQCSTGELTFSV